MTKSEFLAELQELLQTESALKETDTLEKLEEWDSLAIMILISFYDRNFDLKYMYEDVQACKTPADLVNLAKDRLE